MSASDLEREAENHTGQKRDVLLAAAKIMREAGQREEDRREIERALDEIDWFARTPMYVRTVIIDAVLKFKQPTEA
jgi:hypothetical protein